MIDREIPTIKEIDVKEFFSDIAATGNDIPKVASKIMNLSCLLQKHSLGLMNTAKSITSDSEIDVNKSIRNMMITMSYVCELSYLLGMLSSVYITNRGFPGDVAELGMKLGASPEDALKWLLKQKMQGK